MILKSRWPGRLPKTWTLRWAKENSGWREETGQGINEIAKLAQRIHIGYGEAAGQYLRSGILATKHLDASVLAAAYKLRIPVTVHLAIGTDIPHMHPAADGGALGCGEFHGFSAVLRAGAGDGWRRRVI